MSIICLSLNCMLCTHAQYNPVSRLFPYICWPYNPTLSPQVLKFQLEVSQLKQEMERKLNEKDEEVEALR